MILKIEIKEQIENIYKSELSINMVNKNVSYIKGDTVIKNSDFDTSEQEIIDLLKNYMTYWEKEINASSTENSRLVEIAIYTDTNIITYHFENSFPDDLEEFMKTLKAKLNIIERC